MDIKDRKELTTEFMRHKVSLDVGLTLCLTDNSEDVNSIIYKKGGIFSKSRVLDYYTDQEDFRYVATKLNRSYGKKAKDFKFNKLLPLDISKCYYVMAALYFNELSKAKGLGLHFDIPSTS